MRTETNMRYVLFLAATAATGGLLFGFDVAIISGAGPFLLRHFHLQDLSLGLAYLSTEGALGPGFTEDALGLSAGLRAAPALRSQRRRWRTMRD